MKTLIQLLIYISYFTAFAQYEYTSNTYYIIPPTNGCDGVWAVDGSAITGSNCSLPTYNWDDCYTFDHVDGDTIFLNLCSIPCFFMVVSDMGDVCAICQIIYSTSIPEIDAVPDTSTCDFFILPPITGNNLSGNEAYYEDSQGTGVSYQEGDTIWSNGQLYIFDQNNVNCFNCSDEESFNITIYQSIGINNITCSPSSGLGIADACITDVDMGDTGIYSYFLNGIPINLPICNLLSGDYEICVQSANGCVSCDSLQILACDLSLNISSYEISCFDSCDGAIVLDGIGSAGPFTYSLQTQLLQEISNADSTSNLCPDDYIAIITDQMGCSDTAEITLIPPEPISFTLNTALSGCDYPCNGVIILNGNPGLEFSVDNINWFSNGTINGLCPGENVVYAMNTNGCMYIDTITIITANPIQHGMQVVHPFATSSMCTGELQSIASGGVAPYIYKWTMCESQEIFGVNYNLNNLCPGNYKVEVTDSRACPVSSECDTIFNIAGEIELELYEVVVLSNPNNGVFELLDKDGTKLVAQHLSIFDVNGKIVYESSNTSKIDLPRIERGIYILNANIKGKNQIVRFIIE